MLTVAMGLEPAGAPQAARKIKQGRFGLLEDPVGFQVMMPWQGRTLLGDVRGVRWDGVRGTAMLRVTHFNGEPWPLEPAAGSVTVLGPRW